ncbi:MAG TPA: TMEM14 family protein [Allocoleopsis sp.]
MNLSVIAAIGYGVLALLGGVLGYAKVRSLPSLLSGLVSGGLLILSGILQLQGNDWGRILALIITIALIVVFAIRFWKTRKVMPAGLMGALGLVALIGLFLD